MLPPFVIVLYLALCLVTASLGRRRAIGFWGVFALSLLLTPAIMGFVLFLSAPAAPQGSHD